LGALPNAMKIPVNGYYQIYLSENNQLSVRRQK